MESSAQRNDNEERKVTPTPQTTSNNVEVLNDGGSEDEDSCRFIGNLFAENIDNKIEQNIAEPEHCFKESEAFGLTHTSCSKRKQPDDALALLKEESQEAQLYALYRSIKDKDHDKLRFLLTECKIDINHCFQRETYIMVTYKGWRPVHFICKNGDQNGLEVALAFGADVTATTPDGNTALHISCKYGHCCCVEYLVNNEKDFKGVLLKDSFNDQGLTPLLVALTINHNAELERVYLEIVNVLINFHACDVNKCSDTQEYPLHVAVRKWRTTDVIQVLINAGADVNAIASGKSPLIEALSKSIVNKNVIKTLIDAGASVNFQTRDGCCPLNLVAGNTHVSKQCAIALCEAGADPNIIHQNAFPPLVNAIYAKNCKIAEVLIQYGADVNGGKVTPPLFLAIQYGLEEMIKLLLKNRADINIENNDGTSTLHSAVCASAVCANRPDLNIIKLLLRQNCRMENKSLSLNQDVPNSLHPLIIALKMRNNEMVKLLCGVGYPLPEFSTLKDMVHYVQQFDNDFAQWMYDFSHNPQTLLHICRVYIRKRYGNKLFRILKILSYEKMIPPKLSDLILMKDLLT